MKERKSTNEGGRRRKFISSQATTPQHPGHPRSPDQISRGQRKKKSFQSDLVQHREPQRVTEKEKKIVYQTVRHSRLAFESPSTATADGLVGWPQAGVGPSHWGTTGTVLNPEQ
jgi:hypothetical protein